MVLFNRLSWRASSPPSPVPLPGSLAFEVHRIRQLLDLASKDILVTQVFLNLSVFLLTCKDLKEEADAN